ncbi:MAG: hypothetical protein NVSMB66_1720 [Candidatus Doudnabacteria bacterium]
MTTIIDPNLEKLASLMDDRFEFAGFRFGFNFFIDLIPGVGDVLTTLIALYILNSARKYDLPRWKMSKMYFNIGIYFIIGLIPWLGDLFQAWWKPNRRNLALLRDSI